MEPKLMVETAARMVAHQVLFEHQGELVQGPWVPMGAYAGQVSLSEKKEVLVEPGHQTVQRVDRYQVRVKELPAWLPLSEYQRDYVRWEKTWAYGVQSAWPEAWQRGLFKMEGALRLASVELLNTKVFRSAFRRDLCSQLVRHLEGKGKVYPHPFSQKQLAHLVMEHHARYAARIDAGVARALGLPEGPTPNRSAA